MAVWISVIANAQCFAPPSDPAKSAFFLVSAVLLRDVDYALNLAPLQTMHSAVLNSCDAKDGVVDGVLTDPKQCRFDPRQLLCRGGATTGCLTVGQVDSAARFYEGTHDPVTGKQLYPGQVRGGEVLGGVVGW